MYTRLPKRTQVQAATTITANGNSGNLNNISSAQNPMIEVVVSCTGAVSGTTPTLAVSVYEVDPVSGLTVLLGTFANITVTNTALRLAFSPVFSAQLYVAWVVGGTTPSFAGVNIDIYSTPDGQA